MHKKNKKHLNSRGKKKRKRRQCSGNVTGKTTKVQGASWCRLKLAKLSSTGEKPQLIGDYLPPGQVLLPVYCPDERKVNDRWVERVQEKREQKKGTGQTGNQGHAAHLP